MLKYSLPNRNEILPGWKGLRSDQKNITPTVVLQTEPSVGVKYNYTEALKLSVERTLSLVENLPPSGSTLIVKIKDDVDGSGSHPIYHQSNNVNMHNMILYMFSLLSIVDSQTNLPIFVEHQPNSPHAMRSSFIFMGKYFLSNIVNVKDAFSQRSINK